MYKHLNRFTSQTAPHHAYKNKRRRKDLPFVAGEPSPALSSSGRAGPPQAALRRLPSASPPTGRAGPRAWERARRKGVEEHEAQGDLQEEERA